MGYNKYSYDGPVTVFNRCATQRWTATTYAISEEKARSNFAHQYKSEFGMTRNTRVSLPGKIVMSERKG